MKRKILYCLLFLSLNIKFDLFPIQVISISHSFLKKAYCHILETMVGVQLPLPSGVEVLCVRKALNYCDLKLSKNLQQSDDQKYVAPVTSVFNILQKS